MNMNEKLVRSVLVLSKEELEEFKNQTVGLRKNLSRHEKRMRPEIYLAETLLKDVEEVVTKILAFYNMVERHKELSLGVVFDESVRLKIDFMRTLRNLKEETNPEELIKLTSCFTILDTVEKWKFEH